MRWALRERYRSLEREQRIGLLVLALVLLLGAALLAFMVAYRPALVGYPDSGVYVTGARGTAGFFWDPLRVVGYSVFLRAVHAIDGHLSFTTLVQHGLGLATASLLWLTVRRTAGPAWLAVVPAAFVALGGDQLFLEHSILSEALFAFLVASGLYAAVRTLDGPRIAWPAASALLFGLSATVRLAGIALVPALAIWLVAVSPAPLRERAARGAVAVAAGGLIVFGYPGGSSRPDGPVVVRAPWLIRPLRPRCRLCRLLSVHTAEGHRGALRADASVPAAGLAVVHLRPGLARGSVVRRAAGGLTDPAGPVARGGTSRAPQSCTSRSTTWPPSAGISCATCGRAGSRGPTRIRDRPTTGTFWSIAAGSPACCPTSPPTTARAA